MCKTIEQLIFFPIVHTDMLDILYRNYNFSHTKASLKVDFYSDLNTHFYMTKRTKKMIIITGFIRTLLLSAFFYAPDVDNIENLFTHMLCLSVLQHSIQISMSQKSESGTSLSVYQFPAPISETILFHYAKLHANQHMKK